ncbi:MAG: cysteine hydrolase [Lentisphaerae bacterium]|nr:cysteine hydrolase [Lentisphaerota bacterium]
MASYYQQFDADINRDIPAESYGGWKNAEIELSLANTAVVVMHAWDCGTPEKFPGWYRCVEYIPRAQAIARDVFPPLLAAVRSSPLPLFHVISGHEKGKETDGYRRAVALAADLPAPKYPWAAPDPALLKLREFRRNNVFVGRHNEDDVNRGFAATDFIPQASPLEHEGIAENWQQLFALCRDSNINHLIYMGFAINYCLLSSPGGMIDMHKIGVMCSCFREAVTAVENKESARTEAFKEQGLWRTALSFGFVFDVAPFITALQKLPMTEK